MDPNETTEVVTTAETTTVETPDTTEEDLMTAMDEGIAAVTPEVVDVPRETTPEVPGAAKTQAELDAEAAATTVETVVPDKVVEDEIAALEKANGKPMTEDSKNRFRDMAVQIRTLSKVDEAVKAAGIKDISELPKLAERARDGEDLVKMVSGTGATPDDFSRSLDYLSAISKGRSGDRKSVEAARDMIREEYVAVCKALGEEVQGLYDPLSEHPDLKAEIEAGDITRKAALEVVQSRTTQAALAQRQAEQVRQQQTTQSTQAAEQQGIASLVAWEQQASAADPHYAAKRGILNEKVAEIRATYPPHLWQHATNLAYQAIPNPAAVVKPPPGPVRPQGPRPAMAATSYASVEDAMEAGIAAASA